MSASAGQGLEIGLALVLGVIIGVARWREYRWRRSPIGQATAALERHRVGQRVALARWHAFEWCVVVAALAAFAWLARH